jgi:hypothetical protein
MPAINQSVVQSVPLVHQAKVFVDSGPAEKSISNKRPSSIPVDELLTNLPKRARTGSAVQADRPSSPPPTHIDPAVRSSVNKETAELALSQTTAARNVLYAPGPVLKKELGAAASVLHELIGQLDTVDQEALGARLLGKEGLLSGGSPQALLGVLARVREDQNGPVNANSTAHDRSAVIALMGDIAALYADTGATTGVGSRTHEQAETLRTNLRRLMAQRGLSEPEDTVIREVQKFGGSSAVGPQKKIERTRPAADLTPRTGIHNTGELADNQLQIAPNQRIPGTKWDVAHISVDRVAATTEPLVGHMSGSPAEILQVWDMLLDDSHETQYLGTLKNKDEKDWNPMSHLSAERQDQQRARVAGASAFLVGLGYHSAVEVAEGALIYMGQNLRGALDAPSQDAGHVLGHGAATSLMTELFEDQASNKKPA